MKHWYKVNLPQVKLTKLGNYLTVYPDHPSPLNYTCILEPETVLSSNLIDLFFKLNLTPWFVAFFSKPDVKSFNSLLIHSDVSGLGNYQWQTIYGGITFEANPCTQSIFRWFDTNQYTAVYPTFDQEKYSPSFNALQGIHYGQRGFHHSPNAKEIDNISIKQPVLVRTDIAHCVTYTNKHSIRCGISIRFKESLESWETLCSKLSPIFEE